MSAAIVPSYIAKVSRAEKHLVDLEEEIRRYRATKPYAVSDVIEGKKKRKVRKLVFTASPANTDTPIILADAVYNLRSGLDHLMASLVPASRRRSVMFPIFWEGVWEPAIPGENPERAKARKRWVSCVKTLRDEPTAVLKRLQPPDGGREPDDVNLLEAVNRLSNADRHSKLPVVATGLREAIIEWRMPDGRAARKGMRAGPNSFLEDEAQIEGIPYGAVDVEIEGTPAIAVRIGEKNGHRIRVPDDLALITALISEDIIPGLTPYVRAK